MAMQDLVRDSAAPYRKPSLLKPGISELIIPSREPASVELVLPMLAHLSHQAQDRWLTLIGSSCISKREMNQHKLNATNFRLIQSRNDEETLWVLWDALNNGTSAFVVANFDHAGSVTSKERSLLEKACLNGFSRALIIKLPEG